MSSDRISFRISSGTFANDRGAPDQICSTVRATASRSGHRLLGHWGLSEIEDLAGGLIETEGGDDGRCYPRRIVLDHSRFLAGSHVDAGEKSLRRPSRIGQGVFGPGADVVPVLR